MKQKPPTARFRPEHMPAIYISGRPYGPAQAATLANQEYNRGNFQAAVDVYNLILAKFPDCAEAHYNLGIVQNQMKRHEEALASYDRALALQPNIVEAWNNRGVTLYEMKRYDASVASYDKAIKLKPHYADAQANRGAVLEQTQQYEEALASYDKALTLSPDDAATCQRRGNIMVYKGNMQEAERMFHKAIALKPDWPDPLCSLANIRKYQNTNDPIIKRIQLLLKTPGILPLHQECLYFALGKIYDDCDSYDEAFECYRLANQIRNAMVCYQAHKVQRTTNNIIEVFSKDFCAQLFAFASDSQTPLIIVGMPRSGTTLMANIFSNHPSIATAGELFTIFDMTVSLGEMTGSGVPYPQAATHISAPLAATLIHGYEQRLRRDIGREVLHIIDKHPLNFWHLGFIARLFPKARIIHCTRHPLDTGLSNYFQRFHLSYDYSFDLVNIGHFYGEYARLMEHWRNVLPLKMIEISYEEMILKTEPTVRRALASLGLEWDERCLAPHTNSCVVGTASKWQVRQPIYSGSLQRWRHYEKHLGPLKDCCWPDRL